MHPVQFSSAAAERNALASQTARRCSIPCSVASLCWQNVECTACNVLGCAEMAVVVIAITGLGAAGTALAGSSLPSVRRPVTPSSHRPCVAHSVTKHKVVLVARNVRREHSVATDRVLVEKGTAKERVAPRPDFLVRTCASRRLLIEGAVQNVFCHGVGKEC